MSLLRRALRSVGLRVGKDRYLVGTDLEGNSFYEKPHPEYPDEWRKNKRYVEYRVTRYLSDYNYHTIPVQWSSWLRRTRKQPPTLPELETDFYRQLKLKENVSKLEQLYKEEKLRLSQSDQQALSALPEAAAAAGEDGLPRDDVGIGKKEMEIGTNLGINNTSTSEEKQQEDSSSSSSKDKSSEELAKERREFDREQARKRREEFARSQPPTGNPSDSFQPQAWNPSTSSSNPKPVNRRR